ncbi:hypothetical protein PJP14_30060, partial [Mycobacterium kansasii]
MILGMDWLTAVRAEIDCDSRTVTAYGPDDTAFTFPVQVSWPYRVECYTTL